MGKVKHHYVPRFYLANFASEPRRIHIYHLATGRAIRSGSLRDQCYKRRFYGPTDDLEDILSEIEAKIAPVIRYLVDTDYRALRMDAEQNQWLRLFFGLQITRTTSMADRVDEGTDKMMKLLLSKRADSKGIDLSRFKIRSTLPVLIAMRNFPMVAAELHDLTPHLLVNATSVPFFTTDNPVVLYNQYCEGLEHIGRVGVACRGLQVYVPLSPERALLLYDERVYKVGDKRDAVTILDDARDVQRLNLLSAAHSREVILFSDWGALRYVREIATSAVKVEVSRDMVLNEFPSASDPLKSLVHFTFPSPNLGLDLSFMKLRRRARSVSLLDRATQYRR